MVYHLFLIECDPNNSLGGSCIRDLINMAHHISTPFINVFTTSSPPKEKFPKQSRFFFTSCKDMMYCVDKVKDGEIMIVLLSGHGYQMRDTNGDEMDGMDEYITTGREIIKDDKLREIFICSLKTKKNCKFIGLIDTCHSGTMFDLDFSYSGNSWVKDTKREQINVDAISIGACQDNQLDNCDIGKIGYGGALTVHMIDNNLIRDMIHNKHILVYNKLKKIFKQLNQVPVLQKCNK